MFLTQVDIKTLSPLSVANLTKKMGDFTLSAHFSVQVGERVALVGKSGSGKTTLLRTLAGLEPLDGPQDLGTISLGNKDLTRLPPQQRDIGFVFQDQALFQTMSVLENVTFGLRMRQVPRSIMNQEAMEWLSRVGLQSRANYPVQKLSGGERQRVAFIRALIWKPKLVLLDEPFSALDSELKTLLRKELIDLHQLWPAPLILVTHDENDLQAVATHRLHLDWNSSSQVRTVSR